MLTIEILIIAIVAIYLAAHAYSLISQKKPSNSLSIPDLISSIHNKGGGWIILVPIAALFALVYNFIVMSFWFLGVLVNFIAWLLRWIWQEVIVAGAYFIFSLLWHYLIKWPWKLLLLSFGKILSSMKLRYLFVGSIAIFSSLVIMFLGRFFQMLLDTGSWITYLFAVLAIIPIGVGISWIVQILKGKTKDDVKAGAKKYVIHLSFIVLALLLIVLVQGGLVYAGTLTSFSSVFSSLLAGGNLLGSLLIILNSIIIIFSLGALPSFSEQYQGENKDVITSFFKYLINHNWGKYLMAAPAMLIPMIIACIIPYFLTQGISFVADKVSDQVFQVRLDQLQKTQSTYPESNYESWLDVTATSDDSLKVWKRNDLVRVNAGLGIIHTESTKLYLETLYKAHSSMYAAAPIWALYKLFDKFYAIENEAISTSPLIPSAVSIDTSNMNALNSNIIPQIQDRIKDIDENILLLNQKLLAVCDSARKNSPTPSNPEPEQQTQQPSGDNQNVDRCALERAQIRDEINEATKAKLLAEKRLIRAKDVASHLAEVYKLEKSGNSNSSGASKPAYLFVSLWLCLLIGLAFSPIIPLFAQVNHSIYAEEDNSDLYVMDRIRSASAVNPNQPLLGVSIITLALIFQPFVNIPGVSKLKSYLPSLPNLESVFDMKTLRVEKEMADVPASNTDEIKDNISSAAPDTTVASVVSEEPNQPVLTSEEADEQPEYTGEADSFTYNDNLHRENGAPSDSYEVSVKFIVEADGSISEIIPVSSIGYGLEDEIINAIRSTNGRWKPAIKDGLPVRCIIQETFKFPNEN